MQRNKQIFTFLLLLTGFLTWTSCKKDSSKGGQHLLQNKWNLNSVNFYATDGSFHHFFNYNPPSIYTFETNGNLTITPSNGTVSYYNLLSDDSTLIISGTDAFGSQFHDTNFITTLTNNQLVYHSLNPLRSINSIDSLTK